MRRMLVCLGLGIGLGLGLGNGLGLGLGSGAGVALAQGAGAPDQTLAAWYKALEAANIEALENLMAPEEAHPFQFEIVDLGVSQNRAEFIDSMAEWVGAIDGGRIDYKITGQSANSVTAKVCYYFPDNNFMAEEIIGLADDRITGVKQESKGDTCEGF